MGGIHTSVEPTTHHNLIETGHALTIQVMREMSLKLVLNSRHDTMIFMTHLSDYIGMFNIYRRAAERGHT